MLARRTRRQSHQMAAASETLTDNTINFVTLFYRAAGPRLVLIASKGGTATHPAWFHNLIAMDETTVELSDGRTLSVPLVWYPRLLHATETQRQKFRIIGGGFVINWPEIDEHLSSQGLLAGAGLGYAMAAELNGHAGPKHDSEQVAILQRP